MTVEAIPKGYHTLTPYMTVRDAARAIEFYKQAFGAVEKGVMPGPDGKIMHAELIIGDSVFMLADEFPEYRIDVAALYRRFWHGASHLCRRRGLRIRSRSKGRSKGGDAG